MPPRVEIRPRQDYKYDDDGRRVITIHLAEAAELDFDADHNIPCGFVLRSFCYRAEEQTHQLPLGPREGFVSDREMAVPCEACETAFKIANGDRE